MVAVLGVIPTVTPVEASPGLKQVNGFRMKAAVIELDDPSRSYHYVAYASLRPQELAVREERYRGDRTVVLLWRQDKAGVIEFAPSSKS